MLTACIRCKHPASHHYRESVHRGAAIRNPKTCRSCDCPKFVKGICQWCEGYCNSEISGTCWECYRVGYGSYCDIPDPQRILDTRRLDKRPYGPTCQIPNYILYTWTDPEMRERQLRNEARELQACKDKAARKEQLQWLLDGKKTLSQIRQILRSPAWRSLRQA